MFFTQHLLVTQLFLSMETLELEQIIFEPHWFQTICESAHLGQTYWKATPSVKLESLSFYVS